MKIPTPQQARWLSYISEFNCSIQAIPGVNTIVVDALSRPIPAVSPHFDEILALLASTTPNECSPRDKRLLGSRTTRKNSESGPEKESRPCVKNTQKLHSRNMGQRASHSRNTGHRVLHSRNTGHRVLHPLKHRTRDERVLHPLKHRTRDERVLHPATQETRVAPATQENACCDLQHRRTRVRILTLEHRMARTCGVRRHGFYPIA